MQNDKEIVMEAIKKEGYYLQSASIELKNDPEIVLTAVKNYGLAIIAAPEHF